MSGKLRLLLLIMLALVLLNVLHQIRSRKLELKYTISWLILLFVLLIVVIFPELLNYLSDISGIVLPINMVFFVGFCFTLLIIYRLTQAVSKMSEEIKRLTQRIALDEKYDLNEEKQMTKK